MSRISYSLSDIAERLGARLQGGDPSFQISSLASIDTAKAHEITFLYSASNLKHLPQCKAGAVVTKSAWADRCLVPCLIVPGDVKRAYARLADLFATKTTYSPGVHPTACVGAQCRFGEGVYIGPYAVIGDRVEIGDQAVIGPSCIIGDDVNIGSHTELHAQVTLYAKTQIGCHGLIHAGAVIGKAGFALARDPDQGRWERIAQLGRVCIGDHVEVGSQTTIDCGALGDTIIEEGVKIDNQVQIAHNVLIGAHSVIAGCVGIAGSARIGRHCMIGAAVGISDHVELADGVMVTAMTGVGRSIKEPGIYSSGMQVQKKRHWRRNAVRLMHLESWVARIIALEKKINA